MKRMTTVLRELLAQDGPLVYPGVFDVVSARIAEQIGFKLVGIGGNALGSRLCTSEPLIGLEELARQCRYITSAVNVPVKVDAGAGFGDPLHVMRTIRELEAAGVAAIHIEDQLYPKRAHYHMGIAHVIPAEDMIAKVRAAVKAKRDPDLVIIARTDAVKEISFDEGVRRANMYFEAGADLALIWPSSVEEARRAPKEINGPLAFSVSDGNRKGRPVLSVRELTDLGYKIISFPTAGIMVSTIAVEGMFRTLLQTGRTGVTDAEFREGQAFNRAINQDRVAA